MIGQAVEGESFCDAADKLPLHEGHGRPGAGSVSVEEQLMAVAVKARGQAQQLPGGLLAGGVICQHPTSLIERIIPHEMGCLRVIWVEAAPVPVTNRALAQGFVPHPHLVNFPPKARASPASQQEVVGPGLQGEGLLPHENPIHIQPGDAAVKGHGKMPPGQLAARHCHVKIRGSPELHPPHMVGGHGAQRKIFAGGAGAARLKYAAAVECFGVHPALDGAGGIVPDLRPAAEVHIVCAAIKLEIAVCACQEARRRESGAVHADAGVGAGVVVVEGEGDDNVGEAVPGEGAVEEKILRTCSWEACIPEINFAEAAGKEGLLIEAVEGGGGEENAQVADVAAELAEVEFQAAEVTC